MIRAAIVGLGRWGRSLVASVAAGSDDIKFVLACTRTRASAEDFCRDTNIPLVDSYEQILRDPDYRRRRAGDAAQPAPGASARGGGGG